MLGLSRLVAPPGQEVAIIAVFDDGSIAVLGAYGAAEAKKRIEAWDSDEFELKSVKLKQRIVLQPSEGDSREAANYPTAGRLDSSARAKDAFREKPDDRATGAEVAKSRIERDDAPHGVERFSSRGRLATEHREESQRSGRSLRRAPGQDTRGMSFEEPLPLPRPGEEIDRSSAEGKERRPRVDITRKANASRVLSSGDEEEAKAESEVREEETTVVAPKLSREVAKEEGAKKPAAREIKTEEEVLSKMAPLLIGIFNDLIDNADVDEGRPLTAGEIDGEKLKKMRDLASAVGDVKAKLMKRVAKTLEECEDEAERAAAEERLSDIIRVVLS